ncbi:MAG: hypothetical protein ACOYPR_11660 [Saprospiraceae bacterium]|jgi:hypothetical protein
MIRSLIKLGLVLLVCILVYNYFFGTTEEKAQSQLVFGKARELVVAGADVLKGERQKFDAGKYDQVMDQLGDAYKAIRDNAKFLDTKVVQELENLEQRKQRLQEDLDEIQLQEQPVQPKKGIKANPKTAEQTAGKAADLQRQKDQLQKEMEKLLRDSDRLIQDAQAQ